MSGFIVYKFTSPSGKHYVGYSSKNLEERLSVHINDRQRLLTTNKTLPRFYAAWKKYPISDWKKEVLHENLLEQEAKEIEIAEIKNLKTQDVEFGYNMADGGNGGNTGRNGEYWKRKQHSEFLKKLYNEEPQRRQAVSEQATKRMQLLKQNPEAFSKFCNKVSEGIGRGKEHQKFTGYWVVKGNTYETIVEAARKEKLNEWTVNEYCNNPDKIFARDCVLGKKNQSRRECGFYRIQ